jgi:hypothetical protein
MTVLTALAAGLTGTPDQQQLAYAADREMRPLLAQRIGFLSAAHGMGQRPT